jgi:hypothetical protein
VIGAPVPFASIAAIRNRQALADELRGRVYALARLAPALMSSPFDAHKLLRPRPATHRTDQAA